MWRLEADAGCLTLLWTPYILKTVGSTGQRVQGTHLPPPTALSSSGATDHIWLYVGLVLALQALDQISISPKNLFLKLQKERKCFKIPSEPEAIISHRLCNGETKEL